MSSYGMSSKENTLQLPPQFRSASASESESDQNNFNQNWEEYNV